MRTVRTPPSVNGAEWTIFGVVILEVVWIAYWIVVLAREMSTSLVRGVGL